MMIFSSRGLFVRLALWTATVAALTLLFATPAQAMRGRARLDPLKRTFVSDLGTPLRGVYWSIDLCPSSYGLDFYTDGCAGSQTFGCLLDTMKNCGCNALHLYAECAFLKDDCDKNNPCVETVAGYNWQLIDRIVSLTASHDVYLVLTIGGGCYDYENEPTEEQKYFREFVQDFWMIYAERYKNQAHVLYEILNEPDRVLPSPPETIDMEVAAYKLIRSKAPDTPVLFFSWGSIQDGYLNVDIPDLEIKIENLYPALWTNLWKNEAVSFHGYGYDHCNQLLPYSNCSDPYHNNISAMEIRIRTLLRNRPGFVTEFNTDDMSYKLDPVRALIYEKAGVSWLAGVDLSNLADDTFFKAPAHNQDPNLDLKWVPDFSSWPAPAAVIPDWQWVTLKSRSNGKYVTADKGDRSYLKAITATPSTEINSCERFYVLNVSDGLNYGLVALRSVNSIANNEPTSWKYVCANHNDSDRLQAISDACSDWEKFYWQFNSDGVTLLAYRNPNESHDYNKYVSPGGTSCILSADQDEEAVFENDAYQNYQLDTPTMFTPTLAGVESIAPSSRSFGSTAGTGTINVTVTANQGTVWWEASKGANWITLPKSSGIGSGVLTYSVSENSTVNSRWSMIVVGGKIHNVTQKECIDSYLPHLQSVPAGGGQYPVLVYSSHLCSVQATTKDSFISILHVTPAIGGYPGYVTYSVKPNLSKVSRTGYISIGAYKVTVSQSGLTP